MTARRQRRELVPFTAQTRMSGVDFDDGRSDPQGRGRLGAALGRGAGRAPCPPSSTPIVDGIAAPGGTPLVVRRRPAREVLGVIHLKDIVKAGHARAVRPSCGRWASAR